MSNYSLRPAITSEAKPLIGLYAESGCGKTKSALLLAKGFVGDMSKVAMIETESGRGEVYADDPIVGGYLVRPIRENFAPAEYGKALTEVEKAGVKVCIIDSASHEWEGAGGVLGMAAKNQAEGKKGPLVWQQPKMQHQSEFMLRLMQTPIDLIIVCMRAKYPMEEVIDKGEKKWARSKELSPKQSEDILYEMMVHAWIDQEHALHVTKYTKEDFKQIFLDGQPITTETGQRLAAWASGKTTAPAPAPAHPPASPPASAGDAGATHISREQIAEILSLCEMSGVKTERLLVASKLKVIEDMKAGDFDRALAWIAKASKGGAK